ncbi:unnamed protein product [Cylicocyclus nassatus]|uniref:Uncharacterized protein n=1 Tax=Cylicocyclus nassatus TaxID=53992 RepID=A0AA36GRP4_CYLNA|nr:unnamed protein product [Cylicocyclus nassatus]
MELPKFFPKDSCDEGKSAQEIEKPDPQKMEEQVESASKTSKSTPKRNNVKTILLGAIAILVLLAIIAVIIWLIFLPNKESKCSLVCQKLEYLQPHPPLVIISLDGYAYKYLFKKIQPTLDKVAECGVKAKVYPSFPSQTFPNHITIATGLSPGHNGIVGNYIYDLNISSKPEYLGTSFMDGHLTKEPIWSVYQRETKRKAASIMWIGSTHNTTHFMQPHYKVSFKVDMSADEKLDQALDWLLLEGDERPGLILVYNLEPDYTGHLTSGPEVDEAIKSVDKSLERFLQKLKEKDILGCVNIVILSDHGMAQLKNRVVLDEALSSLDGLVITTGANTLMFRNNSKLTYEEIISSLTCKGKDVVRVFNKKTVPVRFQYSDSNRIGDFIVVGQRDAYTYLHREDIQSTHNGDHGYDYIEPDMHAIMFARGPAFKEGTVLPPFINVEYMNLWTKLLQLPEHKNDGEPDFMNLALNSGSGTSTQRRPVVRECDATPDFSEQSLQTICGECSNEDKQTFANWAKCQAGGVSTAMSVTSDTRDFCSIAVCNDMAVMDDKKENVYLATLIEFYDGSEEQTISTNCTFHLTQRAKLCVSAEINDTIEYRTLSAYPGRVLANDYSLIIPWKLNFIKEILDPLNEYTKSIVKKLGKVISITGTAYDEDYDGKYTEEVPSSQYPTHLYRVHIACDGKWSTNGSYCEDPEQTKVLSFIFPHMNGDPNCLEKNKLLLQYTARLKDVESISGKFFNFTNLAVRHQMMLKMHVNTELW